MTAVTPDVDALAGLDFHEDIPCDPCRRVGDSGTAAWYAILGCTCPPEPYCESCRKELEEILDRLGYTPRCTWCGGKWNVKFAPIRSDS